MTLQNKVANWKLVYTVVRCIVALLLSFTSTVAGANLLMETSGVSVATVQVEYCSISGGGIYSAYY